MKKIAFVGQAMPAVKRHPHHWPSLNEWLYSIKIDDEYIKSHFIYTALVNYFPGYGKGSSHKVPTKEEIQREKSRLGEHLINFNPEVVVTVGKLSLENCLGVKNIKLSEFIGKSFHINPYNLLDRELIVIPLPHPSGASTWRHNERNRILLKEALKILKGQIE